MIKRRTFIIFLLLILLSLNICTYAFAAEISCTCSGAAILIDADSGEVLYEKDADKRMLIASTTKIMTALVVLENCDVDDVVEIKPEYTAIEGSSIYLRPGEKVTVSHLLYGLMLESGNDAAVALACHTAGSIEKFAELMNEKASELGMTGTSFKNPNGLDEDGHYSTARDMAVLTRAAMQNEDFEEIVSTKSISDGDRSFTNHNKLLWNCEGVIGVKTGYTKSAGRSLVSCCERDGMKLICVTISEPNDWDVHSKLYDWAFEEYRRVNVCSEGQKVANLPVISGIYSNVSVCAENELSYFLRADDNIEVKIELPRFAYAPIKAQEKVGKITVYVNGTEVGDTALVCEYGSDIDKTQKIGKGEKLLKSFGGFLGKIFLKIGYCED